jgi:hypothetical protein
MRPGSLLYLRFVYSLCPCAQIAGSRVGDALRATGSSLSAAEASALWLRVQVLMRLPSLFCVCFKVLMHINPNIIRMLTEKHK